MEIFEARVLGSYMQVRGDTSRIYALDSFFIEVLF
jgi:hypothetical protein